MRGFSETFSEGSSMIESQYEHLCGGRFIFLWIIENLGDLYISVACTESRSNQASCWHGQHSMSRHHAWVCSCDHVWAGIASVASTYPRLSRFLTPSWSSECVVFILHTLGAIYAGEFYLPSLTPNWQWFRIKENDTKLFCCRAMTGAIVLYDHVDPNGVFWSKSKVQVRSCYSNRCWSLVVTCPFQRK